MGFWSRHMRSLVFVFRLTIQYWDPLLRISHRDSIASGLVVAHLLHDLVWALHSLLKADAQVSRNFLLWVVMLDAGGMHRSFHLHTLSHLIFSLRPHVLDAVVHAQAQNLVPLGKHAQDFCHLASVLALHHLHNVTRHDVHSETNGLVGLRVHSYCDLAAAKNGPLTSCCNPSAVLAVAGWCGWERRPGMHGHSRLRDDLAGSSGAPRFHQGQGSHRC
mmetsp:Transcript_63153/g.77283  ORF Transcript_63153/g.77283 Transcript_63153/m.77283 type:complete len:218 (+) Transcript_63153:37-690(+)